MSSSDDNSSCDDELLNSPPIFSKKDGRTQRAEKQKLDFFDTCLIGTNARVDVQRRIAVLEKVQQQQLGQSQEQPCANSTCEEDVALEGNRIIEEQIRRENATTEANQGKISNGNLSDQLIHESVSSNAVSESEESYWQRVENFTKMNSSFKALQKNTSNGVAEKSYTPILTRKRLLNSVNSNVYNSDSDNDDAKRKNGSNGKNREEGRNEVDVESTELQACLGLRWMFRKGKTATNLEKFSGHQCTSYGNLRFYMFQSRNEAIDELKSVVSTLSVMYRDSQSLSEKLLYQYFIIPLALLVKNSQEKLFCRGNISSLSAFFRFNPVISTGLKIKIAGDENCLLVVPELFCQWMWKVACSSYSLGEIVASSRQILVKFLMKDKENDFRSKGLCDTILTFEFLKKFVMGDLSLCLINDFGLWMGMGNLTSLKDGQIDVVDIESNASSAVVDVQGLTNLFNLWESLLSRDFIILDDEKLEDNLIGHGATRDLVALARISLDPRFHLKTEAFCTADLSDTSIIQKLITSLVRSTVDQISTRFDLEHVKRWMKYTAKCTIDSCSNLSKGDEGTADSDDIGGYLPLATVVQIVLPCKIDSFSCHFALLKLFLAEEALNVCFSDMRDWDKNVSNFMAMRFSNSGENADNEPGCNELKHAVHALTTSEAAFKLIDEERETFLRNLPRFLASIQIAGECAFTGILLFWCVSKSNGQSTTSDKATVNECTSNIEDLCDSLRKECGRRSVITYPHLRRAKEYLTRLGKSIAGVSYEKPSKEDREKRRAKGSLDCFLRSSQDDDSPLNQ